MTAGQRARRVVASRVATARARLRAERSLAGWDRAQRIALPSLDPGRVPVVFCTWRRLGRLGRTLDQLSAQDLPVQALIWNNSGEREPVDIAAATARIPVFTYHSPRNIGGFGRFYLARELAAAGHRSVVLIDDDQDFGPSAVSDLASMHRPGSLSGWWAFRFRGSGYGDRARVAAGEPASYVGTGGMIADTSVFLDGVLFDCPRRFWFVDDLWLCYVARQLCGYELFGSAALFECGEDEHALYRTLGRTKWQFLRYLIRQGWDPAPGSAVTPG